MRRPVLHRTNPLYADIIIDGVGWRVNSAPAFWRLAHRLLGRKGVTWPYDEYRSNATVWRPIDPPIGDKIRRF